MTARPQDPDDVDERADVEPDAARRPASGADAAPDWRRRFAKYVTLSDALVLIWVVFGTQILWLGPASDVAVRDDVVLDDISYWIFSTLLVAAWMAVLALNDSRSYRVIGTGSAEYKRVFDASFVLFGVIAIFAFLLRVDVARGFLLISLPLGVIVLFAERWLWRYWLTSQRARGGYSARVLLVGSEASVLQIAGELRRTPSAGYLVVGACLPAGVDGETVAGTSIPVLGDVAAIEHAIASARADTVVVTSTDELPPYRVKEISWSLEAGRQHLVLAPSIVDIAGPRIHMRPVAGLPLIHVETPRFSRGQRFLKRTFDIVVAPLLIVLLSGVLVGVAIAVKRSSPGPVFYRQERIGWNGRPFSMIKFRSMRTGADAELAALLARQGTDAVPLFKVRDDPRITATGRFIRKYSLDELPQLFNVVGGSMSLVGPRPQIAAEVALYSDAARRRLLARPGVTGLWQVSGRSALDWDQTVRLDLYYVENWSMLGDLIILFRTVKSILAPGTTAL